MTDPFNPEEYWENRLSDHQDLRGTGHRAFSVAYNQLLYRAQKDSLDMLLDRNAINFKDKDILDIGSGFGFYIDYFLSKSPRSIRGVDITEVSVNYLKNNFPKGEFFKLDISSNDLTFEKTYDFISAIYVLIHIIDDQKFTNAVSNICMLLNPGGYLLITDTFKKTLIPNPKHVRLRSLSCYQSVFDEYGVRVVDILPVYYFLDKISLPGIGGRLGEFLRLGKSLYHLDYLLKKRNVRNYTGSKMMLAVKTIE